MSIYDLDWLLNGEHIKYDFLRMEKNREPFPIRKFRNRSFYIHGRIDEGKILGAAKNMRIIKFDKVERHYYEKLILRMWPLKIVEKYQEDVGFLKPRVDRIIYTAALNDLRMRNSGFVIPGLDANLTDREDIYYTYPISKKIMQNPRAKFHNPTEIFILALENNDHEVAEFIRPRMEAEQREIDAEEKSKFGKKIMEEKQPIKIKLSYFFDRSIANLYTYLKLNKKMLPFLSTVDPKLKMMADPIFICDDMESLEWLELHFKGCYLLGAQNHDQALIAEEFCIKTNKYFMLSSGNIKDYMFYKRSVLNHYMRRIFILRTKEEVDFYRDLYARSGNNCRDYDYHQLSIIWVKIRDKELCMYADELTKIPYYQNGNEKKIVDELVEELKTHHKDFPNSSIDEIKNSKARFSISFYSVDTSDQDFYRKLRNKSPISHLRADRYPCRKAMDFLATQNYFTKQWISKLHGNWRWKYLKNKGCEITKSLDNYLSQLEMKTEAKNEKI